MLHDGDLIRIRISGEPHYTLLAKVIDSVNGIVRVTDTTSMWNDVPIWKFWNNCELKRPQWMKVSIKKWKP